MRWSRFGSAGRDRARARQTPVEQLPSDTLLYLLGSRYSRNRSAVGGRLAAVRQGADGLGACAGDLRFRESAHHLRLRACRLTKTAWDAFNDRTGVCRDFAHLAITFCRCMNIPARHCTGYLGDIGMAPPTARWIAGWFEAYLDGQWCISSIPATACLASGRVLIAQVAMPRTWAISNTFGPNVLKEFSAHRGGELIVALRRPFGSSEGPTCCQRSVQVPDVPLLGARRGRE